MSEEVPGNQELFQVLKVKKVGRRKQVKQSCLPCRRRKRTAKRAHEETTPSQTVEQQRAAASLRLHADAQVPLVFGLPRQQTLPVKPEMGITAPYEALYANVVTPDAQLVGSNVSPALLPLHSLGGGGNINNLAWDPSSIDYSTHELESPRKEQAVLQHRFVTIKPEDGPLLHDILPPTMPGALRPQNGSGLSLTSAWEADPTLDPSKENPPVRLAQRAQASKGTIRTSYPYLDIGYDPSMAAAITAAASYPTIWQYGSQYSPLSQLSTITAPAGAPQLLGTSSIIKPNSTLPAVPTNGSAQTLIDSSIRNVGALMGRPLVPGIAGNTAVAGAIPTSESTLAGSSATLATRHSVSLPAQGLHHAILQHQLVRQQAALQQQLAASSQPAIQPNGTANLFVNNTTYALSKQASSVAPSNILTLPSVAMGIADKPPSPETITYPALKPDSNINLRTSQAESLLHALDAEQASGRAAAILVDNLIVSCNNRFCEILGYTPKEIKQFKFTNLFSNISAGIALQLDEELNKASLQHACVRRSVLLKRKDGSELHVDIACSPQYQPTGEFTGHYLLVFEQVHAEGDEIQSELMTTMLGGRHSESLPSHTTSERSTPHLSPEPSSTTPRQHSTSPLRIENALQLSTDANAESPTRSSAED